MIHPSLRKKQRILFILLLMLISVTATISMGLGAAALSYDRLIPVFLGEGTFKEEFVLFYKSQHGQEEIYNSIQSALEAQSQGKNFYPCIDSLVNKFSDFINTESEYFQSCL